MSKVETLNEQGYTVEIWNDQDAQCPWEDWDGCVPLMVAGGRGYNSHDYENASEGIRPSMNLYRRHKKALLAVFDIDTQMDGYGGKPTAEDLENEFTDAFDGAVQDEDLEKLAEVARITHVPHLLTVSRGYSQGDAVQVLAVWPKAWGAANRPDATKKEIADELEAAVKLFGDWAWGNVYGFTVEGLQGGGSDSCGGFFGYDHEKSGLLEMVRDTIARDKEARDKAAKEARDKYAARVKGWIRGRAPLDARAKDARMHAPR